MDSRFEPLFEPLQIGSKTMRNRFYAAPQCSGFGSDRPGAQAYHRALKAAGGFAVVHTEWCAVHSEADHWPTTTGRFFDESDGANLALMVDLVHKNGALAGIQLGFDANNATGMETRTAGRDVTQATSNTFIFHSSYEMDVLEIEELQGFYIDAAVRARDLGFDVINVCVNENASVAQHFLMPIYNPRTDDYGGPIENRTRFLRELLEQMRPLVADDCAVTVRLSIDTMHESPDGIRAGEEGVAIVRELDHLVDLWDFEVCGPSMAEWGDAAGPSRFFAEGYQLPFVKKVRPHSKKPVVNVGRFVDPYAMAAAVASGAIDAIGMARPGIADPYIPTKIREGRFDDIRECIGCNICIAQYEQKGSIICTQNPTIGEEYRRGWHPERFLPARNREQTVLIIGAGPAGLECAVVLGRRGMSEVHVVDRERYLGGHVNWVAALPGLGEWRRVIDHRHVQIEKLSNVTFVPGKNLTCEDVLDYGGDLVIVADGADWATDGFSGVTRRPIAGANIDEDHIFTPEKLALHRHPVPEGRVVVYDTEGYFMAASLAEKLALEGRDVLFMTPLADAAPYMEYTLEHHRMLRRLAELRVEVVTHRLITAIDGDHIECQYIHDRSSDPVISSIDCAAVLLCTERRSRTSLYRELKNNWARAEEQGATALHRIGDCVVPRKIADVIFDGHRLAREIDSEDPSVPLPFIRERRVLGATDADFDAAIAAIQDPEWPISTSLGGR